MRAHSACHRDTDWLNVFLLFIQMNPWGVVGEIRGFMQRHRRTTVLMMKGYSSDRDKVTAFLKSGVIHTALTVHKNLPETSESVFRAVL